MYRAGWRLSRAWRSACGRQARVLSVWKGGKEPSLASESSKALEAHGHLSALGASTPPSAHPTPPGVGGPGLHGERPGEARLGGCSRLGPSQPPPRGDTRAARPRPPSSPPSSASDPPAAVLLGTFLGAFSFPRLAATAASHHLEA